MMSVYLSSGAFKAPDLATLLKQATDWGLKRIELSSGVRYSPTLLETLEQNAANFDFLVHNYFPPPEDPFVLNLGSEDDEILARSIDHCRRAIDLSRALGAGFYSVHSGFAMRLRPDDLGRPEVQGAAIMSQSVAYETAYARFVESVSELCRYADECRLDFLIENNVLAPVLARSAQGRPLLMVESDEINRFFSDVDHPRLGLLMDTGHTKVSATALSYSPQAFIEDLAPHIRAFHLSDNDGQEDQNLPFASDAWFAPYLHQFPDAPLVVEVYRLEQDQMHQQLGLATALNLGQEP
jgi:sugar phosphate isomerase/epimerase